MSGVALVAQCRAGFEGEAATDLRRIAAHAAVTLDIATTPASGYVLARSMTLDRQAWGGRARRSPAHFCPQCLCRRGSIGTLGAGNIRDARRPGHPAAGGDRDDAAGACGAFGMAQRLDRVSRHQRRQGIIVAGARARQPHRGRAAGRGKTACGRKPATACIPDRRRHGVCRHQRRATHAVADGHSQVAQACGCGVALDV